MQAAWMNRDPAVMMNIHASRGANIISVVDRVKKVFPPQLQAELPAAVNVSILTTVRKRCVASVKDVQFGSVLTVVLVVMVIFLFLRNLPATTVPASRFAVSWARSG